MAKFSCMYMMRCMVDRIKINRGAYRVYIELNKYDMMSHTEKALEILYTVFSHLLTATCWPTHTMLGNALLFFAEHCRYNNGREKI